MTKKIIGFMALGFGAYLAYQNMDKLKEMTNSVAHMMNKEYKELEDML